MTTDNKNSVLFPDETEAGKWYDANDYASDDMTPILCCGFIEQPSTGTAEYDLFLAQYDEDEKCMVELNSRKPVSVYYWQYAPEKAECTHY